MLRRVLRWGGGIGRILAEGYGLGIDLYLDGADGWYARSGFLISDYKLAVQSESRGLVADGIESRGVSLDFEMGKSIRLGRGVELVPRMGITQTSVSLGSFTDRVGADVGMPRTTHRSFNVGMTTKFKAFRPLMDGDLALQASIDFEKSHDGEETRINASGEDLISVAPGERLVLGLEGQGQRDRMFVKGGVRASVSNSENTRYSGHITFGMTF